jgi:hypothetical protein
MSLSLNSMWDPCKQGYNKSYTMSKYFFLDSPLFFFPLFCAIQEKETLRAKAVLG